MAELPSIGRGAEPLRALEPFRRLPASSLDSVAAAVRWLRVPAGRWLVRPGRALSDHLYLLEGRVRLQADRQISVVGGGSRRARRPVYPGAGALVTLTACRFAAIDAVLLERVAAGVAQRPGPASGAQALPGLPRLLSAADSWQGRFLASPLLQKVSPSAWQRLLRAMEPRAFEPGATVIRAGAPADGCYVLQSGRVQVLDSAGRPLVTLYPGRLFGEDALVTGRRRNATVSAPGHAVAAFLPAEAFRAWLLQAVIVPLTGPGGRVVLGLDGAAAAAVQVSLGDIRSVAARLSPRNRFAVAGATLLDRALAALLLAEQGLDAQPLA